MRQNVYKNTKLVLCWPSLRMGQTLQCGPSIQWDSFGETRLCFADGCQLEMASGLRIEACVQFPSQLWEPPPGWSLCRPCVCCHGLGGSCVCQPVVLEIFEALFPWYHLSPLAITILLSLIQHCSLSSEGRPLMKESLLRLSELGGKASDKSHLRPSVPNISHSVHAAQL